MPSDAATLDPPAAVERSAVGARAFLLISAVFVLLHVFFMVYRMGQVPSAPVVSDEVVINDPSVSLARGHGYIAESFGESKYGLDKVYAHFPPLYPYTEALVFRVFGVSAVSLRGTTTVMSIASTLVLVLLLYRMCVFGMLRWDVAALVQGLYCSNASYVALERMARMESMVSLLVLVSLYCIMRALTLERALRLPWLLAGGVSGALTIAVHPEAVVAVLLLAAMILFVVPTSLTVRLASAALFVLTPLAVGIGIYRTNLLVAMRQFLAIAKDADAYGQTTMGWLKDAATARDLPTLSRNSFVEAIILLLLTPLLAFVWQRRTVPRESLQYRMALTLSWVGVVLVLVTVFAMHFATRRVQFLYGVLLVCCAVCVWGSRALRPWQRVLGWTLVAVQTALCVFYVAPRRDRMADANPDRYMSVVRKLPRGVPVAATAELWLDMKEPERPFTLILNGLDGESTWGTEHVNPLQRFDVVVLGAIDTGGRPWLQAEAAEGRTMTRYTVGSDVVEVYVRSPAVLVP